MKRLIILPLLFLCLMLLPTAALYGQNQRGSSISGKVCSDGDGKPVGYALIRLFALPDTTLATGTMADSVGQFKIEKVAKGNYLLQASFFGYESTSLPMTVQNRDIVLPEPIVLSAATTTLDGVYVTAKREEKQAAVEKTQINVAQNLSSVSGNIIDVLKSYAAVSVDGDNTVYLRGNKNILILIDGVPTTVSSLGSIPASSVDNIEIITNPDVRYDAEGTGGIINIVTKKGGVSGFSGAVTLNYGFLKHLNGGVNLRYAKGKWDVGFNYNSKYDDADVTSSLTRELYGRDIRVEQQVNSEQLNRTHALGLRVAFRPTKKDLLTLNIKAIFPKMNNLQKVEGQQQEGESPLYYFNRTNDITFARKTVEGALGYKHIFEKGRHELSISGSFSRTRGSRPAEYYIEDVLLQKSSGGGTPTNYTVQADYLKALPKAGRFEAGLKLFSRWNNFDYKFYNLDTLAHQWNLDTEFSNGLKHQEYIYSAYLMYADSLSKRSFFKIGARLEYNTTQLVQEQIDEPIKKQYLIPFPYLQYNFAINKHHSIAAGLNRRVTRPTYPQLNPFVYVIDDLTYESGNRNLEPEVMDKAEFNYTLKKGIVMLRTNLYYSFTQRFITQVSMLTDDDKLMMTFVNGDKQHQVGGDLDLSLNICKYFAISPSVSMYYTKTAGMYNEIDLRTSSFAWNGNLKLSIRPERKTEIQIVLNYASPRQLPQFDLDQIFYADIAVKRPFFKDRLTVSLALTDVLNTRNWIITSNNSVYQLNNNSHDQTRILWIGLSYNFNSYKIEKSSSKKGEEKDRKMIRLGAID